MEKPCVNCQDRFAARTILHQARILGVDIVDVTCDITPDDPLHRPKTCFMRFEGLEEPLNIPTSRFGDEFDTGLRKDALDIEMQRFDLSEKDLYPRN